MSAAPVSRINTQSIGADERAQMLELAERVAGVGHWHVDLVTDTLFWSREIFRIHGKDPETFTPEVQTALDYYHPDDAPRVRDMMEQAVASKQPFEFECRILLDDGSIRWVHSRSTIQTNSAGNATAVFGIFQDVTEQRELKAALETSNARFDLAIRGSSAGVWDWRLDDDSMYWSSRFREMIGVDDVHFHPTITDFANRIHPDDAQRISNQVAAHIKQRLPFETEYRLRHENGSYLWVRATGQATWSDDGIAGRMAGSIIDISDSKLDEQMREQVYQLLTDERLEPEQHIVELLCIGLQYLGLDIGIVSRIDGDTYTVEHVQDNNGVLQKSTTFPLGDTYCAYALAQRGVTAIADASRSEISDHPCYDKFGLEAYIGVVITVGGKRYGTLNFSSARPRGSDFGAREHSFVAMLSQWIANEIGQKMAVEELIASREILRQQQQELDLIFNRVPVRIWFKDDENRILRLNEQAADSMGMSVQDAEGASTYDLFPAMAAKYHADDLEVIDSGEPCLGIIEAYTPKQGTVGWSRTDKVPFTDPMNGQRRLLVVSSDISELMRTQAALEYQTALLKRSNRDLDDFAYIASHDLRAPMRGIDNLAEWIEEDIGGEANPETLENLRLLRGRVARMDRMLGDILKYSRAGKDTSDTEAVDCRELLEEIRDWVSVDSTVVISIGDNMPTLNAPRTSLQQVFLNLISNAIKHHDREHGSVSVQCAALEDSYRFSVTDDGPGIPEKYQQRIFRMFETLKRRDEVEASGVGLAIVDRLVQSLGGSIEVQSSASERGTTFVVTLPADAAGERAS